MKSLHRQIALLRDANARLQPTASPHALPIVFTVRSKGQIGMFPDESPGKYVNIPICLIIYVNCAIMSYVSMSIFLLTDHTD